MNSTTEQNTTFEFYEEEIQLGTQQMENYLAQATGPSTLNSIFFFSYFLF